MKQTFIHYLITDTDSEYLTTSPRIFKHKLSQTFKYQTIHFACFRAKDIIDTPRFQQLAKIFIKQCKIHKIKAFINSDIGLAHKLGFDGIHLTSKQFDKISLAKELGLTTIISTHDENEIQKSIKSQSDYITYSPIFFTPHKGKSKGIFHLKKIVRKYNKSNIIALGGITNQNQINKIKITSSIGFASIRYFKFFVLY